MARKKTTRKPSQENEAAWQFMLARVMQIAGIPLIGLIGLGMWTTQTAMQGDINTIKTSVALLQSGTDDRYRASQARSDFALRDQKVDNHESRIDDLEDAVSAMRSQPMHPPLRRPVE